MIRFRVDGVPVAQPRQRQAVRNGFVSNYTPTKHPVNAFKAACKLSCPETTPASGPVELTLMFVMPRPKSMMWKTRATPRVPHAKKPDADNLAKSVKDALTGLLWRDDSQVARLHVDKVIAAGDEQPHVVVQFEEIAT